MIVKILWNAFRCKKTKIPHAANMGDLCLRVWCQESGAKKGDVKDPRRN